MTPKSMLPLFAAVLMLFAVPGGAETSKPCVDQGPPSIWVVKSEYPFQAGAEKAYDEMYHGPWRARVAIVLYAKPRSRRVVGKLRKGTVVLALVGETIVIHPLRFVAAHDYQLGEGSQPGHFATMHAGDVFWVLDSGNEGEFAIWWQCHLAGWDSTEASTEAGLNNLGTNEERWVKVRDPKSGLVGWFHDVPIENGPQLVPAHATTKSAG